jgi:NADH dehydrogenase [ubiquinone] 1 alpha subcomplex assembly factor 2
MRLTCLPCAGFDLEGNTYWEFRLTRGTESNERWRRIVNYPRSTHYSQVKVSPQWHQWLRHTRKDPPTIVEQQDNIVRQERIKVLAAQADARWEAKPKVMEAPETTAQRLAPVNAAPAQEAKGQPSAKPVEEEVENIEDPWAKAKTQGPGESWQPTAWDPTAPKKR